MRAVAATGYDGSLSLEIFNDQFRGTSPYAIAVDGHRSLLNLMDEIRRETPQLAIAMPNMPARMSVSGFEFVEFAASEAEAGALRASSVRWAFARPAATRPRMSMSSAKAAINIVINTDPEGFAHSSFRDHGISAYALGLKVEDAASDRGAGARPGRGAFEQTPLTGRTAMPAIKGLGDSLLLLFRSKARSRRCLGHRFCPAWRRCWRLRPEIIDHVAQTMNYDEMLTWVLFYTSLFVVDKTRWSISSIRRSRAQPSY